MTKIQLPTCHEKKKDCFARSDGRCTVLTSTVFKKECPFYRPIYKPKPKEDKQ